jgi:hypothetical protein
VALYVVGVGDRGRRPRRAAALLALAVVLCFVLPTAWSAFGNLSAPSGAAQWLGQAGTMAPMIKDTMSGTG